MQLVLCVCQCRPDAPIKSSKQWVSLVIRATPPCRSQLMLPPSIYDLSALAPRQTVVLTVHLATNDSCDACEPPSFPRDVKEALKPSIQSPIQHQWLSATAITHVRPHTDHTFWTVVPDQFPVFSSPSLHLQVRAGLIVTPARRRLKRQISS